MVSIEDLEPGSGTAQIILQLPIRSPGLELDYIHLIRHDSGRRTLWTGLGFKEINENRSWTTIEVLRSELHQYKIVAQYRNLDPEDDVCAAYELTVDHSALLPEIRK